MYLQSKLMLRLNEREEKVKETIRGIREKLKQNKVLNVSLIYLERNYSTKYNAQSSFKVSYHYFYSFGINSNLKREGMLHLDTI